MSVLINMEMPESCVDCMESYQYECSEHLLKWCCRMTGRDIFCGMERDESCPLVSVPKHGRLIDADALTKMCQEMQSIEWNNKASPYSWAYAYESFEGDIDNAPTIIPAEEAE